MSNDPYDIRTATEMQVELCRVWDCEKPATVLVDVQIIYMNDEGVEDRGAQIVAMCRSHAMEEQRKREETAA